MRLFNKNKLLGENMELVKIEPLRDKDGRIGAYEVYIEYEDEDNWKTYVSKVDLDIVIKER